jgi:hypothetical protein
MLARFECRLQRLVCDAHRDWFLFRVKDSMSSLNRSLTLISAPAVLFANAEINLSEVNASFIGKPSFSWPRSACRTTVNAGCAN